MSPPAIQTRSDRILLAVGARGGRCSLQELTADVCRKGMPAREVLPAATIAVLAGSLEILPGDVVSVVDTGERVTA